MVFQRNSIVITGPEVCRLEEGITEAIGTAGYLADHWDPSEIEIHHQLRINTERIKLAAIKGDTRAILRLTLENETLHDRWDRGNGREDPDHQQLVKVLRPVMGLLGQRERPLNVASA